MSVNKLYLLILIVLAVVSGCKGQGNSNHDTAMRIAETLKESSLSTTEGVKIHGYLIQSEDEVLIAATVVNWNSKDNLDRDFMKSLAYDFARGLTCRDKALRKLLAEGIAINVAYASNDDQEKIGVKILDQSCHDIATNPPLVDMFKKDEQTSTSCSLVGSAHKAKTGEPRSVYRCAKSDGAIQYVIKTPTTSLRSE